jgi:hypothetical protein
MRNNPDLCVRFRIEIAASNQTRAGRADRVPCFAIIG